MICDLISGEPKVMEPDKNEQWQWFSWDNLPSPLIIGCEELVKRGLNPCKV